MGGDVPAGPGAAPRRHGAESQSHKLAVFHLRWTSSPSAGKTRFVVSSPGSCSVLPLSGSGLVNHLVPPNPSGRAPRALLSDVVKWSDALPPSPIPFQKLLWASCHAGDTPMINFDFHQFAKGGKLEKLENLLQPHLKLHWDDFDVFTRGENVSPR